MPRCWIFLLLVGGFACQGCGLPRQATHVLTYRTKQAWNDRHERKRNWEWAEKAWNQVCRNNSKGSFSEDHATGFRDGFADYLYQGGTGEPPILPPKNYRTLKYQTPKGYRAIEDWYAGYRHGSSVAMHGGYRRWVVGPPPPGYEQALHSPAFDMPTAAPAPLVPVPVTLPVQPPTEALPAPRVLPPTPTREEEAVGYQPVGYVEPQSVSRPQPQPVARPAPIESIPFHRNSWSVWSLQ